MHSAVFIALIFVYHLKKNLHSEQLSKAFSVAFLMKLCAAHHERRIKN